MDKRRDNMRCACPNCGYINECQEIECVICETPLVSQKIVENKSSICNPFTKRCPDEGEKEEEWKEE